MLDASQGVESEEPARVGEVVQVGGREVVTYGDPHLWWQVRHHQGRCLQLGLHLSGCGTYSEPTKRGVEC